MITGRMCRWEYRRARIGLAEISLWVIGPIWKSYERRLVHWKSHERWLARLKCACPAHAYSRWRHNDIRTKASRHSGLKRLWSHFPALCLALLKQAVVLDASDILPVQVLLPSARKLLWKQQSQNNYCLYFYTHVFVFFITRRFFIT